MPKRLFVHEDDFTLEIWEWSPFTLELFKAYSDWRCNGNNKSNKSSKSNINNVNKINNISNNIGNNISNQQEEPLKTFVHNPDVGTPISDRGRKPQIEEWIHKTKKLEFTLEEYFQIYPKQRQNRTMVYTHISRLINKKSLLQIGENKFKIMV